MIPLQRFYYGIIKFKWYKNLALRKNRLIFVNHGAFLIKKYQHPGRFKTTSS
jgi:hypothetical protein